MKTSTLKVIIVFFLLIPLQGISQVVNKWFFGNGAALDFNSGSPVSISGSAMNAVEGSSSISDISGNLLFYTDGIKVWNNTHIQMPNGFGLFGHWSSPQSALIVPIPGSSNVFYIFTVDYNFGSNGLRYSIVDMNLQGGLGDVTAKNVLLSNNVYEKLSGIRHSNGIDVWIIYHHHSTDRMHANLLTSSGINSTSVISNLGPIISNEIAYTTGWIKGSPDGCKVAMGAWWKNSFLLMDFNNETGTFSNLINIQSSNYPDAYGVEFSPDGKLLYGATASPSKVFQFNLQAGTAADIKLKYF